MMLEQLFQKTDQAWYEELFQQLSPFLLKQVNQNEVIARAMACAEECYSRYPVNNDCDSLMETITSYGVQVRYVDQQITSPNLAYYDDSQKELVIFESTVNHIYFKMMEKGLDEYLSKEDLNCLILSHELYHMIEMNEADIYSYSDLLEVKWLGFFKKKVKLEVASEIAAYHYSKCVTKLPFSPRIVEL